MVDEVEQAIEEAVAGRGWVQLPLPGFAVRLRPDRSDSRQNLQVVEVRRIIEQGRDTGRGGLESPV